MDKRFTRELEHPKINVISRDARLFINQTDRKYDVVLMNLPVPNTTNLNRFYTIEFFKELKQKLKKGAVVSTGLMATVNYMSEEAGEINSVLFNTMKKVFKHVIIIPGQQNYYVASDRKLTVQVVGKMKEKQIESEYILYYLDDYSLQERGKYIRRSLSEDAGINRDLQPVSYFRQQLYWLSHFKLNYWILGGIVLIIFVFIIKGLNPVSAGMFTGGFAASSIEVLLLIVFQIFYGYVYHMIGIIITIFMAGLALGTLYLYKFFLRKKVRSYIIIQLSIAVFACILPVVFWLMNIADLHYILIHAIFFLLTIIISLLVGIEFSLATRIQSKAVSIIAAETYSADLFGSALGALLFATILIPVFGVLKVCAMVGVLCLSSALLIFVKRGKFITPSA